MSEFVRREICEGVAFSHISDDRFKIGRLSVTLTVPLAKETAAAYALLVNILTRSCKEYPDFTALSRKLDSLYGASLYPLVNQMGDHQSLTITVTGIDDQYALDDQSVSSELAQLLCMILFDPNVSGGKFSQEDFEQEKRQLLEDIDAEYSEKRMYAIKRCTEIMCRDEVYAIGRYGSRQDVEALTNESVYKSWEKLLKEARIDITFLGNTDPQKAFESFQQYFVTRPRTFSPIPCAEITPTEVKRIAETEEVSQSKLVMGFRCAYPQDDKEALENSMMSAILGGLPTSKLFLNVREKQSLCYYCSSSVDNNKGIMIIDSGVETANIENAEQAILEQVNNLKNGIITDSELEDAKLALKNSALSALDNLGAMQSFYLARRLRKGAMSPLEAAAYVDSITKEKIIALAKKLELDTVYSLVGN